MRWLVVGATVLLLAALAFAGVVLYSELSGGELETAAEDCAQDGQPRIGDNGDTLVVDSSDGAGTANAVSGCVIDALNAPDSVRSKFAGTSAMMGRQSDTFDGYEVTWTYHPDEGLNIIVEQD